MAFTGADILTLLTLGLGLFVTGMFILRLRATDQRNGKSKSGGLRAPASGFRGRVKTARSFSHASR